MGAAEGVVSRLIKQGRAGRDLESVGAEYRSKYIPERLAESDGLYLPDRCGRAPHGEVVTRVGGHAVAYSLGFYRLHEIYTHLPHLLLPAVAVLSVFFASSHYSRWLRCCSRIGGGGAARTQPRSVREGSGAGAKRRPARPRWEGRLSL